jgi:hypothetical protein
MGGFFSSIFGGQNKTLNANIPQFGQDAGVAGKLGTGDATSASKFYEDVLSGDPTKSAEAIAPETAAANEQAQQAKNQAAQFGPRSGGTTALMAGLDANTRAQLIKLLGGLKTTAASGAASLGTAEQGLSLEDKQAQDAAAQQRLQNFINSIVGKSAADFTQTALNAGEGAMGL